MARGTNGNDTLSNSSAVASLDALSGNDIINNYGSRSTIRGGAGNDLLYNDSAASGSFIDAGAGNDIIYVNASNNFVNTGTGNDTIENAASSSVITLGGSGNDTFYATDNPELLILESGAGDNIIYNIGGEDTISIAGTLSDSYGISNEDVRIGIKNVSGSINIKNGVGKTLTIVDSNGVTRKKFGEYLTSPQDVIKKFMASLDQTTLQGSNALDEAVKACSSFTSMQSLINQLVADCRSINDAETFLRDKCGIIIDNQDTGAISGWDVGGATVKNNESIVPESGSLDSFSGNSFTVNGLTVKLDTSFSSLTDKQKQIWRGLHTWWLKNSLDLIEESFGTV